LGIIDNCAARSSPRCILNNLSISIYLGCLTDDIIDIYFRAIDELMFGPWENQTRLNHLIHLISQLLIHSKMLHSCCFIDQVDMRFLLLLSIIIHIWFGF
jgi:hypothetical protein